MPAVSDERSVFAINSSYILPENVADVKPANLLRQIEEGGVKPSEIVSTVQRLYPGYEKTLHSKCKNGEKYGIMLRPDAMAAVVT